jgi:hypothetical protein
MTLTLEWSSLVSIHSYCLSFQLFHLALLFLLPALPDVNLGLSVDLPSINLGIQIPTVTPGSLPEFSLPIPPLGVSLGLISLPEIPVPSVGLSVDVPSVNLGIALPSIEVGQLPSFSLPIPPIGLTVPSISLPDLPEIPLPPLDGVGGIVVRVETSTRTE